MCHKCKWCRRKGNTTCQHLNILCFQPCLIMGLKGVQLEWLVCAFPAGQRKVWTKELIYFPSWPLCLLCIELQTSWNYCFGCKLNIDFFSPKLLSLHRFLKEKQKSKAGSFKVFVLPAFSQPELKWELSLKKKCEIAESCSTQLKTINFYFISWTLIAYSFKRM